MKQVKNRSIEETLALRSERQGECLVWTGAKVSNGYGQLRVPGTKERKLAHRAAWEIANGPIPEGLQIDHVCGNRACVGANHLRLATNKQNHENNHQLRSTNTSGARGVYFDRLRNRWYAKVCSYGVTHWCGYHDTFEEANRAATAKRLELFTFNEVDKHPQYA